MKRQIQSLSGEQDKQNKQIMRSCTRNGDKFSKVSVAGEPYKIPEWKKQRDLQLRIENASQIQDVIVQNSLDESITMKSEQEIIKGNQHTNSKPKMSYVVFILEHLPTKEKPYPRFLCVEKKYTYSFLGWVFYFAYPRKDKEYYQYKRDQLIRISNKMTDSEAQIIQSQNKFEKEMEEIFGYQKQLSAVDQIELKDLAEKISAINQFRKQQQLDLPKGKKLNDDECQLKCALREMKEESGIEDNQIELKQQKNSIEVKILGDDECIYTNRCFIALPNKKFNQKLFDSPQPVKSKETTSVKFCSLEDLTENAYLKAIVQKIYERLHQNYQLQSESRVPT